MSHVTPMIESCHKYEWLIHMCVMTHIWISPNFSDYWLLPTLWPVMTYIWMSHVTHMNEPCHTYEWVMSHIWMSHVTHMNESCHIYEWVMSHIWMSNVTHMNESCHTYEWVMSHIWMSHVTRINESCHTNKCNPYSRTCEGHWLSPSIKRVMTLIEQKKTKTTRTDSRKWRVLPLALH